MPNFLKGLFGAGRSQFGKAVDIQRQFYTMTTTMEGDEAEIVMYGDIVQETPRNWWTGEPIEGSYIILDEFIEDLDQLAGVSKLTIRLNSCGGDAYAAIPIHNRLRELKATVVAIVDGVAMSGGSLIMCAADKVRVNPSSLIMIHKCWCLLIGGYNADELRKIMASNEAVDKAQVAIYRRKTGMEEADILSMMADETYMTGSEAAEKGFADEVFEGEPVNIAASADKYTLYVNGRERRLPYPLTGLPESIPTVNPNAGNPASVTTNNQQPAQTGGTEGGKTMAKTLEELKKENPDLANELMAQAQAVASAEADKSADAANEERERIKEIDEVADLYPDGMVQEAKYGNNPCTAQELAYRAAKEMVKQGKKALFDMEADTMDSGSQQVASAPGADESGAATKEADIATAAQQAAKAYLEMIGGKKNE